jgi:glycosyltransferase involved in cell wall biosynthesis
VLLVAHLSPPSPLIAARRVAAMTKYLSRLGHSVTVLTSAISGDGPIEGADAVVRTFDLMASGLNWRRRHFEALTGSGGVYRPVSRVASVVVPDVAVVGWLPFALRAAREILRERRVDCVLTTSPPQSAHAVGYALRRRGVPWIAELRDGWTFEPPRPPWPTRAQRSLDERLERRLLTRADAVVGVTRPIADDAAARLGVAAPLITNGFDPEDVVAPNDEPLLSREKHAFVYTGRAGVAERRLEPLIEGVRLLVAESPELADRLELVFAGPMSEEEAQTLADASTSGFARTVGALDRPSTLRLQRAAGTLLVLTRGARSEATGKLFEYLAAGRPILVLGDETEAARIVRETRTGEAVSATDPEAISRAVRRFASGDAPQQRDETSVARYSWAHLSAQYDELIRRACS